MEIDFDVKSTGQTKTINGFDTREVIITVTAREKGKKLEDSGGVVMTVDNWLTKSQPALKEIRLRSPLLSEHSPAPPSRLTLSRWRRRWR